MTIKPNSYTAEDCIDMLEVIERKRGRAVDQGDVEAVRTVIAFLRGSDGPQLPSEIDRSKHGSVLMVWNDCMINHETLEMTWPKLVKAMQEAEKRTDATQENK